MSTSEEPGIAARLAPTRPAVHDSATASLQAARAQAREHELGERALVLGEDGVAELLAQTVRRGAPARLRPRARRAP